MKVLESCYKFYLLAKFWKFSEHSWPVLHITIRYGKILHLRETFDPDLPQVNVLFVVFTFARIVIIITNVKIKTVFQRIFLLQIKKNRTLPSAVN